MPTRRLTLTLGLLTTALTAMGGAGRAAYHEQVAVYLDGEPVDFVSKIRGGRLPALMVDGHPMVSVRFIHEVLGYHLDLHMYSWGIVRIGFISFKLGCDYACTPQPSIGGTLASWLDLPVPAKTINGRLYLPAVATLGRLHRQEERAGKVWSVSYEVDWDAEATALRITTVERELGAD